MCVFVASPSYIAGPELFLAFLFSSRPTVCSRPRISDIRIVYLILVHCSYHLQHYSRFFLTIFGCFLGIHQSPMRVIVVLPFPRCTFPSPTPTISRLFIRNSLIHFQILSRAQPLFLFPLALVRRANPILRVPSSILSSPLHRLFSLLYRHNGQPHSLHRFALYSAMRLTRNIQTNPTFIPLSETTSRANCATLQYRKKVKRCTSIRKTLISIDRLFFYGAFKTFFRRRFACSTSAAFIVRICRRHRYSLYRGC